MEDFLAGVLEFLGDLLENALRGIKNPRKRKWALTIYYFVIALLLFGVCILPALALYKEGNLIGAQIMSGIACLLLIAAGFFIIREHRKN